MFLLKKKKSEAQDDEKYCGYCGERLPSLGEKGAGACPCCLKRFGENPRPSRPSHHIKAAVKGMLECPCCGRPDYKDPVLAALLSTVLPGAGQVYNHQILKGVLIFVTSWLVIPYFIGIADAFLSAHNKNNHQAAFAEQPSACAAD